MTSVSDLLRIGDRLIDTKVELPWLAAIIRISENRKELVAAFDDLAKGADIESLDGLLDLLSGKLDQAEFIAAFADADLTDLREQLKAVEDQLAKLPKPIQTLIKPMSLFKEDARPLPNGTARPPAYRDDWIDGRGDAGEIELPLSIFKVSEQEDAGAMSFTFDAKMEAALRVEAGALWPYARDEMPDGLLEIALDGTLSAKAGASAPFQSSTLDVGGQVGAQAMLYFRPKADDSLYAVTLAQSIAAMPNLFDLKSVWRAMEYGQMAGQIFAIDGYASAQIDVGLGKMVDVPKILSADLNVSVTVGIKQAARFIVSARRIKGEQAIRVAVSHNTATIRNAGIGATLALDLSPAFAKVRNILEDVVPKWDQNLAQLKPYLSPGAKIREEAGDAISALAGEWIKDAALRDAVVKDLGLLLGSETGDSALKKQLVDAITEKLNGIAKMASDPAAALAQRVIDDIVKWLPSLARDDIRTALQGTLATGIEGYQNAIAAQIARIAQAVDGRAVKRALEALGAKVDGKLNALDERTAALRRFVENMDSLIHKALDFVSESANHKIALEFGSATTRTHGADLDIDGRISAVNPQTSLLWNAMMMGQLRSLQRVFDDPGSVPGFDLDPDKSRLSKYSKRTRKTGFTFVGFGLELSASQLLSAEATVTRDANGDIIVAASSEISKEKVGFRESRSIGFMSSYGLMLAKAMDIPAQRTVSLNMAASHKDKSLKASEVRGLVESLSKRGLVSPNRVNSALDVYTRWTGTQGAEAKHPRADIDVRFALLRSDFGRLLVMGGAVKSELKPGDQSAATHLIFDAAYEAIIASGFLFESTYAEQMRTLRRYNARGVSADVSDKVWLTRVLQFERQRVGGPKKLQFSDIEDGLVLSDGYVPGEVANMAQMLNSAANMLHLMAEIYDADPKSERFPNGWDDKRYEEKEALMASAAGNWLDLNSKWIFWFRDGIGPRAAEFLALLIGLGRGLDDPRTVTPELADGCFTITMTQRNADGTAGEVVVI